MERIKISEISEKGKIDEIIKVAGWVKSVRNNGSIVFVSLNDGSTFKDFQIVVTDETLFNEVKKLTISSSVEFEGILKKSNGKQDLEINANKVNIINIADLSYPLQKKGHSVEYLRTIAHLRPRTNLFKAVFKIRSIASIAIHEFFNNKGFIYVHTPIITASDAEGAGEMFSLSDKPLEEVAKMGDKYNEKNTFFNKEAHLTVSGQLNGEAFAHAFGDIYTFGPTFRAENSNTQKHAAEFWMIEPEMAFVDLNGTIAVAEEMLKYIIKKVMNEAKDEIEFLNKFVDTSLKEKLESALNEPFAICTYSEAIERLIKASDKKKFENKVEWGIDLATEHETYLAENIFKKPVFLTDYPKDIKAFYMKENKDGKTVAAVDLLVPRIGELIGGSQREESFEKLEQKMKNLGMNVEDYWWYLDLRKYGSVIHSGFGLGFERLIMFLTGVQNIRDVLPFPRTPKNCEF